MTTDDASAGGGVRLVGLVVGDDPAAWRGLGFDVDGLAHRDPAAPVLTIAHANGVTAVDHVVATTPHVERTTAALATGGITSRRSVDGLRGSASTYRFFVLGTCVLELIGPTEHDPARSPRPATFAGLAFAAPDLGVVGALPGVAGTPRDAIQPGRRIVTLATDDHDISVPLAILTAR